MKVRKHLQASSRIVNCGSPNTR